MSIVSQLNSSATQADQVFEALSAEILSCRLPPGSKIKINDVAARLGVSVSSVREALSRLSAEGMVVAEAQKGNTVAPVSTQELVDLTKTRISIEQLCLRNAIEHGDVEWETSVVAAYHRLHRISERDITDPPRINEAWAKAHSAFHLALVAGCNSPSLMKIRERLYAQTERYRRLSLPLRNEERDVNAEHKAMLDAVISHNSDLVCGLISDHLWRTTKILLDSPVLKSQHGALD